MNEIMHCPFCGNEYPAIVHLTVQNEVIAHQVECWECGVTTKAHEEEAQAVAAWNQRVVAEAGA